MVAAAKNKPRKEKQTDTFMLKAALRWASLGIPVFSCKPATKEPLTSHGFKDATTDEGQIQEWWAKWPTAMIGMPTGKVSGIDVLDLDVKPDEGIDGRQSVGTRLSPVIVRTPSGGEHQYFGSQGRVRCTTDVIGPGVDTRGEGGYVIVPPSRKSTGKSYEFLIGDETALHDLMALPPFPDALLNKLGERYAGGWGGDTPQADPTRVAAAMAVIGNPDLGWGDWKKFGLAIWRATGGSEEGFEIFDQWSKKSRKYDAANTRRAWDEITRSPPTRIGAGTIFHAANAADPTWRTEGALILPAGAPLAAAEAFIKHRFSVGETPLLRHFRGAFYHFTGTHYREYPEENLERDLYQFLNAAMVMGRDGTPSPYNPTKHKVSEIAHALRRGSLIPREWDPPFWLGADGHKPAAELIAVRNGTLNIETRQLLPHDPLFFSTNCLPLDYDPAAPKPKRWGQFLEQVWPGDKDGYYDAEAEETLQEIAGYLLTSDTRQQKIFLIIGPTRSGKGTIVHVLEQLLGKDNCVFPTLGSMAGEFGRWPLIDKKLAAITDARIGASADTHKIAEQLLSISGGDHQTINRKNQAFWTGRLNVRFLITTNVLPAIRDTSGTIATRYILLKLTQSFLGREDLTLREQLSHEMGGILNWALDGLDRLRQRGFFRLPNSAKDSIRELEDAAEPVRAFVREWCERGPKKRVNVKELYRCYRPWAEESRHKIAANNSFGRALKALLPELTTTGVGAKREYLGITLSEQGKEAFETIMMEKGRRL